MPFAQLPAAPRLPHAYGESRARTVVVDSSAFGRVETHVREWGDGPPLLLVHGLMTSSYSWRYVARPLARHFRVIAPDMPGAGRTTKVLDRAYSAENHAVFIGELVDALGIRGAPAFGNSLGGYLCMQAVLRDPTVFSRLVNLHSPGLAEPRLVALSVATKIPGVQSALAWWIRRSPRTWAHANVHYWDESLKSLEEAEAYGAPLSTPEGARAFARILGDVLAPSELRAFEAKLRSLDRFPIPLLLVYARQDPMVPPAIGERLSKLLPHTPMVWLEETSHFAHVDTPEKVLDAVTPFLRGLSVT